MKRSRIHYFVTGCMIVALGLASRRYAGALPEFLALYAGDTLWAAMVFVGIGFLATRWSSLAVASTALAFSYLIECSQLYHSPWIDTLRQTRIGGLVLGYGFLWSDILCYSAGVALAVTIEIAIQKVTRKSPISPGDTSGPPAATR